MTNFDIDELRSYIEHLIKTPVQEVSLDEISSRFGKKYTADQIVEQLEVYVADGRLKKVTSFSCPICDEVIFSEQVEAGDCGKHKFVDEGKEALKHHRFLTEAPITRDTRWIIVVHGMNTRGNWQEDVSWRIANKIKYHVPVLIYKYGWASWEVLFTWKHRHLSQELGSRIKAAIDFIGKHGVTSKPDVIVHSFGSRLFSMVLTDKKFEDLKFGRIITCGSIVHPNYDWDELINCGRVSAVLNHCGGKDVPVTFAQFTIPNTGPSGRIGFCSSAVTNVMSESFRHSDVFHDDVLEENLSADGLWRRFLSSPDGQIDHAGKFKIEAWRSRWGLLRWAVLLVILAFITGVMALVGTIAVLGSGQLLKLVH